jgi:hypothetical protein
VAVAPAPILRLQRTIGNRATVALLRQPRSLKNAGVTPASTVDGKTTARIQAAVEESVFLKPFLKGKFPASAITAKGAFKLHDTDRDFTEAVRKWKNDRDNLNEKQLAVKYKDIGGFYDRRTKTMHVRPRASFGHALHEAMHRLSYAGTLGIWGSDLTEGMTQYFTDCLLKEHGLPPAKDHKYQDELACAQKLVDATTPEMVAGAYFNNDQALQNTLMQRFKLDLGAFLKETREDTLCARF